MNVSIINKTYVQQCYCNNLIPHIVLFYIQGVIMQLKKYEQLNFLAYRLTIIRKLTLNKFPKLSSECCT